MGRTAIKKRGSVRSGAPSVPVPTALAIVGWALVGAALLGALERHVWLGALFGELGLHLTLLSGLTMLIALFRRSFLLAGGLALLVVWFGWPLFSFVRAMRPTPQAGPVLRVATAHLAGAALDPSALSGFLARERPDALALTGVVPSPELDDKLGSYSVLREPGVDATVLLLVQSALAVASGHGPRTPPRERREGPRPRLAVRAGRCQAHLAAIALPSITAYGDRTERTRAITDLERAEPPPRSIWLGHLGSRAEAHDLDVLMHEHGLRDGRFGHGRLPTTPAALGPLGFPRSDVLVQGWIAVRSLEAEPPLVPGADRTLLAVLELTEPRCRFARATPSE